MIGGLLYPLFVLLGLVVSVEDWRERKIRNRWILAGLGLCGLALCFLLANTALGYWGVRLWSSYDGTVLADFGHYYMPWQYYAQIGGHLLLSSACAYALWRYSVWPAGDAKLFIVFALLLPLVDPNLPGFPRMLFVVMLINIFVPAGIALSVETVIRLALKVPTLARVEWSKDLWAWLDTARVRLGDHWPQRYNFLALGINLFSFFTAFRLTQRWLIGAAGGPAGRLLVFAVLILAWGRVRYLLFNRLVGACALCALSGAAAIAVFWRGADLLAWIWLGISMMFNFGMFLSVARGVLGSLAEEQSLEKVSAEDVRPGMILAEPTWHFLRGEPDLAPALGESYCDGLTADEAHAVKGWLALEGSREKLVHCRFYRAVPFALWIFLGSILTFRYRSTFLHTMIPSIQQAWQRAHSVAPWWSL